MHKELSHRSMFLQSKLIAGLAALMLGLTLFFAVSGPAFAAGNANLLVDSSRVELGGPVSISGSGFQPGEEVSLWLTSPNGDAVTYGRTYAYDGTFSNFTNDWASDAMIFPGTWYVTATGLSSGAKAVSSFRMVRPMLAASALMVGNGMSMVNIAASGWYPGEQLTFWLTDSNGKASYLGYAWVYSDGSIISGKSFETALSPGYYRLSAHGNISGRTLVSAFNSR
ncbi:MAG TPA: hypothetical protein VH186_04370 [Chloroflexia bacterium]|nr:hypothetical protein [Chloroflexia bacterium]